MYGDRGVFREKRGNGSLEPVLIPHCVEDVIADIATVFHWQPQAFEEMSLQELMLWREKARERAEME